jgi:hypothetical protein
LISRIRLIFERPITIASSCGMAPPDNDVPAPRGTTLTPTSLQYFSTCATSSVDRGRATASGIRR